MGKIQLVYSGSIGDATQVSFDHIVRMVPSITVGIGVLESGSVYIVFHGPEYEELLVVETDLQIDLDAFLHGFEVDLDSFLNIEDEPDRTRCVAAEQVLDGQAGLRFEAGIDGEVNARITYESPGVDIDGTKEIPAHLAQLVFTLTGPVDN